MDRTEFRSEDGRSIFVDSPIDWADFEYVRITGKGFSAVLNFERVKPVQEPTGLGAVVRAGQRGAFGVTAPTEWVRVPDGYWHNKDDVFTLWENFDLQSVVVLSEGWTPDE